MSKLPECDYCLYCAFDRHIVCALHPTGIKSDSCPDFTPKPEIVDKGYEDFLDLLAHVEDGEPPDEELWHPIGARFIGEELAIERSGSFYNGEEIVQQGQRWSREEMLEMLDTHPIFTGRCPNCEMPLALYERPPVHYDCPYCNWKDDTV